MNAKSPVAQIWIIAVPPRQGPSREIVELVGLGVKQSLQVFTGTFGNGTTQNLSQLRLVRFANPGGLIQVGDNLWAPGPDSGPPIAGVAGQGAFGQVVFGALEGSNVDLGEELVGMIVNKAFAGANLAALKTQNEMIGTLLDTVR